MKVEVEELESLLGPEDSEVDVRRILEEARNTQGRAIFETFSSEGPNEYLVVSRARWDEYQRKMSVQKEEPRRVPLTLQQNSFSSMTERQWQADLDEQHDGWSFSERRVAAAMEDDLEKFIDVKVESAALELFMEAEEAEVCLRYILKHAKRRGSSRSSTQEKNDHLVASRRRWLEHQGERVALQESYEGTVATGPPCPGGQ